MRANNRSLGRYARLHGSEMTKAKDPNPAKKKAPNPTDKHVGSRVRMQRLMLGMSQQKLAAALGLTFQQIQKYEKGTNRISASRFHQIANILHVPVSFFFEGAPQPAGSPQRASAASSPEYVTEFLSTSVGIALASAFMRIKSGKLRRSVVQLVQDISQP
jgi:transcriptional regulator with XRE-family HTH domain